MNPDWFLGSLAFSAVGILNYKIVDGKEPDRSAKVVGILALIGSGLLAFGGLLH